MDIGKHLIHWGGVLNPVSQDLLIIEKSGIFKILGKKLGYLGQFLKI
jgi:hypothetical protein